MNSINDNNEEIRAESLNLTGEDNNVNILIEKFLFESPTLYPSRDKKKQTQKLLRDFGDYLFYYCELPASEKITSEHIKEYMLYYYIRNFTENTIDDAKSAIKIIKEFSEFTDKRYHSLNLEKESEFFKDLSTEVPRCIQASRRNLKAKHFHKGNDGYEDLLESYFIYRKTIKSNILIEDLFTGDQYQVLAEGNLDNSLLVEGDIIYMEIGVDKKNKYHQVTSGVVYPAMAKQYFV